MPLYVGSRRTLLTPQPIVVSGGSSLVDVGFSHYLPAARGGASPTFLPTNVIGVPNPSSVTYPFTTDQASTDSRVKWQLYGFSMGDNARSRNASLDVVSGMSFEGNNGTQATFLVKGLPAGTYSIYLAAGDDNGGYTNYIYVMDGGTAKLTLAGVTNSANHYVDATGASVVDTSAGTTAAFGTPLTGISLSGGNISVLIGSPASESGTSGLSYIRFKQTA